jgi:Xaa-Pro dipeptidase
MNTAQAPTYAMFSRAEMDRRYSAARDLMERDALDALLITGEENLQYFVGTSATLGHHYALARPSVFILPLRSAPIIITQGRDKIVMGCYVSDIRDYFDVLKFPHQLVVQALRDTDLVNRRVGAELGQEQRMGIPVGSYGQIVADMPDVTFTDAANIIIKLRMVKSQEEVDYIQKAADITGRARQRLYRESIVPGVTERDVARAMRRLILEEGGDRTSFVSFQHDLPGDRCQFHYERPLTRGMVLGVDTGAFYWMYTIDYVRFAVLGKATDEQKRLHELVKQINSKMVEALRPGVRCSELHRIVVGAISQAGVQPDDIEKITGGSRFGHGQGMLLAEPPSINRYDDTQLEPGIVLSTEPGIRFKGVSFLWEDVHVITEAGHRQITHETDELTEIPF